MSELFDSEKEKDATIQEIVHAWLRHIQLQGRDEVANHMMGEVKEFGEERFGKTHQVSSYERAWRKCKQQYHWRFYKKRTDDNGVTVYGIIQQD